MLILPKNAKANCIESVQIAGGGWFSQDFGIFLGKWSFFCSTSGSSFSMTRRSFSERLMSLNIADSYFDTWQPDLANSTWIFEIWQGSGTYSGPVGTPKWLPFFRCDMGLKPFHISYPYVYWCKIYVLSMYDGFTSPNEL